MIRFASQPLPPLRNEADIQGNVLAGFNKNYAAFLFVEFPRDGAGVVTDDFRTWLRSKILPHVATNCDVTRFNEQFSAHQNMHGGADPVDMQVTWLGMSLTGGGLTALAPSTQVSVDANTDLEVGAGGQAPSLQDSDATAWLFGGTSGFKPDAIITIAGDRFYEVEAKWRRIKTEAENCKSPGVRVELGATLPGDRVGHEHFGFKDGVSQPMIADFDFADPADTTMSKKRPDVRLVDPAQFLVEYRVAPDKATWMRNGSFMVYRRLAQDVKGFWDAIRSSADKLSEPLPPSTPGAAEVVRKISTDDLAAKVMGRWRNGTPVSLSPDGDPGSLQNPDIDRGLAFGSAAPGSACPFGSHVRKMHPREDVSGDDHRIIRRGIPFGDPYDATEPALGDVGSSPRGLQFVCYASSYAPFRLLQSMWANGQAPHGSGGLDPIIQTSSTSNVFEVPEDGVSSVRTVMLQRFVQNTAAVFAFTPTISSLTRLIDKDDMTISK